MVRHVYGIINRINWLGLSWFKKKKVAKFLLLCQFIFKESSTKIFCMRPTGLMKQRARYELSSVHQEMQPQPQCSPGKVLTDFRGVRF